MTGLRMVGWGAGMSAAAGTLALLIFTTLLPVGGSGVTSGSGATFATFDRSPMPCVIVTSLRTDGAETQAGLRVGDKIAAVNGIACPTLGTLESELHRGGTMHIVRHGDAVALTLLHGQ